MDVVSVLFLCGLGSWSRKTIHHMNTWSNAYDPMYVGVVIYKNVRTRSINVVMAMLWNNAFNNACWKMFQHNNKYMNVIWLKPWTGRCGGSCLIQILNPESALGMDQISRHPPIFRKFFAFWGTAWGVQKNWVMGVRQGGKIWISSFCTVYKEKPWYSVVVKIGKHLLEQTR